MSGITNRGKIRLLEWGLRREHNGGALPTNLYIALVTSAAAPDADTNTFSELTEIANGNGYTSGGYQLSPNDTDFDTLTEDDSGDQGRILIKDVVWTASGGTLPASGNGARYAVLLDDNGTIGSREVLYYWDLTSDRQVSSGQTLTLQDLEVKLTES
jgi:hypothetical protein